MTSGPVPVPGAVPAAEVGEGPTCLVLHGWPGTDHTYLRPGLDVLASRLRLVYVDHRGHGRTPTAASAGIGMTELADDARDVIAHLGGGPVLVLGHHSGAAVALELAIRHPESVAGLVLVAASPGELGSSEDLADFLDAPLTPPEADIVQRVPPATDEEVAATMAALEPFFGGQGDPVGTTAGRTAGRTAADTAGTGASSVFARVTFRADAAVRWMHALMPWSAVDRAPEIPAPTLLIVGSDDVFCPPTEAQRIARRIPAARVEVLEGAGHLPWRDQPERFSATVLGWVDEQPGPAVRSS